MKRGILIAVAAIALGVAIAWPRLPQPWNGTTLVLTLTGDIPERLAPTPLPSGAMLAARWLRLNDGRDETPLAMIEIWRTLRAAARDPRIARLRIEPSGLRSGWAKLEELRAWIGEFAKSGKPVDCYLRSPGMREYFVATAAKRIAIAPGDWLNLRGLRAEVMSFKGALDKLGVVVEIEAIGKYKDAGDSVTRESISSNTREVLDSFLDARIAAWNEAVAKRAKQAVIDDGPYLAARAKELGLVDALEFPSRDTGMRAASYRWVLREPSAARVAVVTIEGAITGSSPRALKAQLDAIDDSVRGVLVRVSSPGGEVIASDEMLELLRKTREERPMIFSFSDVAASGGYAIAMTGDPLYASPGTVTGSIGVLYGKADLSGLYAKLGLHKELLLRGQQAAIDSEVRPLGEEGRRRLRAALTSMYEAFVAQVAKARKLDRSRVAELAEGRAWLGAQAHPRGLVDSLGGWDAAVRDMKQTLRLAPGDSIELVMLPARESWAERIVEGRIPVAEEFEALSAGAMLRRAAYEVEVR